MPWKSTSIISSTNDVKKVISHEMYGATNIAFEAEVRLLGENYSTQLSTN